MKELNLEETFLQLYTTQNKCSINKNFREYVKATLSTLMGSIFWKYIADKLPIEVS